MTIALERQGEWVRTFGFTKHADGFGVFGGRSMRVDDGEALIFRFDHDVLVESVSLVAGDGGRCGGYYTVGEHHPLAIYCVDADNDAKDQQGILSDLGVLKRGQPLRLDTRPHLGVEAPGRGDARSRPRFARADLGARGSRRPYARRGARLLWHSECGAGPGRARRPEAVRAAERPARSGTRSAAVGAGNYPGVWARGPGSRRSFPRRRSRGFVVGHSVRIKGPRSWGLGERGI